MATSAHSTRALILGSLKRGRRLSTANASRMFGVSPDGVRARITELRKAGFSIYTNKRAGVNEYRLGRPTRRVIAAGNFLLSKPGMRRFFGKTIDKNLSLV